MGLTLCVDALKVSEVVDTPSRQWHSIPKQRRGLEVDGAGVKHLTWRLRQWAQCFGGTDALRLVQKLHRLEVRCFESLCEAVMWKITTHGFTLQEVLILAAMNIATAVTAAERCGQGTFAEQHKKEHTSNLETS
jgi:hypothetical protein